MRILARLLRLDALFVAGLLALAGGAALLEAGAPEWSVIDDDLEPLRSSFNATTGSVRAVLLAAPT